MQEVNATAGRPAFRGWLAHARTSALARQIVLRHMGAMSMNAPTAAIDHLVLPTASLQAARVRFGALGFTVAPTGVHPFGTANCCVYLADGTFLEPLAIVDAGACEAAVAEGNVFVARDRAFRAGGREDGFSAVVLATRDAEADHDRFGEAGFSAGDVLFFSRPFEDAMGRSDTASFRLAFASAPGTVPFVFTCQRVNAPSVDRSSLERHANGATRMVSVRMVAGDRAAAEALIAMATGVVAEVRPDETRYALANAAIEICAADTDEKPVSQGAFDFRAVTFAVSDLSRTRLFLEKNGVGFTERTHRIIVPPAPGQGATFIFEERA